MSEKLNLIFFRMSQDVPLVKELTAYYKGKGNYNIEFISNGAEANQYLATEGSAILILEVKTKLDLQNSVTVLKAHRKLIKNGLIKPACILHVKNKKVEKILSKYGCVDQLDEDIKGKTFSFKIDFWSRGLTTLLKKKEKDLELKQGSAKKQDKKDTKKTDFNLVDPLKLQSDIWLFKTKSDYKKILRRWLLRSLGPSPHIGKWAELEPQPGDKLPTWKYVLSKDDGQYILEDGAWYFSGSKPEFDWKINRWNFSSDAPHLYFYTNDGQIFSRFKFEDGAVTIAENSQYALTKEEMILESCDSKFNIEADEAQDDEASSIEGDSEADELSGKLDGSLEGSEEDLGGQMGGKLKGGAEDLGSDITSESNFSEDDIGGSYDGKGSTTNKLDDGPLSGNLKKQELASKEIDNKRNEGFSEEDTGGHYGGKSSTDEIQNNPLGGKVKTDSLALGKEKEDRDSGFQEEDNGGHYGGKTSTDTVDRSPFGGKLKPSAPGDEKENNESSFDEDDKGGHYGTEAGTDAVDRSPLGAKSKTDQVDRSPLGGKLKPNAPGKEKEDSRSSFNEDDKGGHYGGESSTDALDRSPLGGKLKPNAPGKEKEDSRSSFNEDDKGGHYGGESSTDALDRSPLGGKLKPNAPGKEKEDSRSSFNEDDQGGHYGGEASTDEIDGGPLAGKSSTDELDHGPLGGKLKPQESKEKENKRSDFSEDDLGGHLGGEASTDQVNRPNLSGKTSNSENKESKEGTLEPGNVFAQNEKQIDEITADDINPELLNTPEINPLAQNPELAAEVDDELSRAGLQALDKDGNPIPMSEVAQMTEEELSRAGIKVLDKDGNEIATEDVATAIDEELSRAGLQPLAKDIQNKKEKAIAKIINNTKTSVDSSIKNTNDHAKNENKHAQNLEAKSGSELWADEPKDNEASVDLIGRSNSDALKGNIPDGKQVAPQGKTAELSKASPFGEKKKAEVGELEKNTPKANIIGERKEAKNPFGEKKKTSIGDNNSSDTKNESEVGELKESTSKVAVDSESKAAKNPFGQKKATKAEVKANEMEEALGGGLSDSIGDILAQNKKAEEEGSAPNNKGMIDGEAKASEENSSDVIWDEVEDKKDRPDLSTILNGDPQVNTGSAELRVVLKQSTKAGNDITFICNFEDFYEDELIVHAPKDSLAVGSSVKAKVSLSYGGRKVVVFTEGKIEEKEEFSEKKETLIISVENIDKSLYDEFIKLYQDRQENIQDFMQKAKGF